MGKYRKIGDVMRVSDPKVFEPTEVKWTSTGKPEATVNEDFVLIKAELTDSGFL